MIKNIAAFGDSWIYGDEIEHPDPNAVYKQKRLYREEHCIVGQLGRQLGLFVENYGVSGNSLSGTVWEFHHWLTDEHRHTNATPQETLVVVGLTECSRESWWNNNNFVHNHIMHDRHPWNDFVKHHYLHNETDEFQRIKYWQTTEFFYNYCKANSIPLLMFNVFAPPYQSNLVTTPGWNMRGEMAHRLDELAPGMHPNEKGCKHLANILTPLANNAIMHEC
jgi:hypothetical protein